MKDQALHTKNIFFMILPYFTVLINILVLVHCGGGFRQDSENAQEFSDPLFNNREFVLDTTYDTTNILK